VEGGGTVIPAEAGIHIPERPDEPRPTGLWIPAFGFAEVYPEQRRRRRRRAGM